MDFLFWIALLISLMGLYFTYRFKKEIRKENCSFEVCDRYFVMAFSMLVTAITLCAFIVASTLIFRVG